MKYVYIALVAIMVVSLTHVVIAKKGDEPDCKSPLLKKENNPDGAPEASKILKEPKSHAKGSLKACKGLEGKGSCCSADHINGIKDGSLKTLKNRFTNKRKEQSRTLTRIEKDIDDNADADAEMEADLEAFKEDAMSDDETRRVLTAEGQQTRLLRLLESLTKLVQPQEFLARNLEGEKGKGGAGGKPGAGGEKGKGGAGGDKKPAPGGDKKAGAGGAGGEKKAGGAEGAKKKLGKELNDNKKKNGRTPKEGGRPGAAADVDRKEDGSRMTFEEMLDKYKPKGDGGKRTKSKDGDYATQKKAKDSAYKERMDKVKKAKPGKDNKEYMAKDAAGKKKYKEDRRKEIKTVVKDDYKKKMTTYKDSVKKQKTNLQAAQKKCFKALMKYTAGSLCAACDANYQKKGWLVPSGADAEKSSGDAKIWKMKVNKKSCGRLQTACFDYVNEKFNVGQYVREAADQEKKREEYKGMKKSIEGMAKCMDDGEKACSKENKEKFIKDASKVQKEKDTENADKTKKHGKFQAKFADQTAGAAPVSVKLPDGCVDENNCKWICTNLADTTKGGANFDAVDMRDQESTDGKTKFTRTATDGPAGKKPKGGATKGGAGEGAKGKTGGEGAGKKPEGGAGGKKPEGGKKGGRVLSTGFTISNEVGTTDDEGYEADSDANTGGFDASAFEFNEEVDSSLTGTTTTTTTTTTKASPAASPKNTTNTTKSTGGNGINKAASLMTIALMLAGLALMN